MRSGESRANRMRAERQEQLRDYLSKRGLVEHVIETCSKLEDFNNQYEALEIQRIKIAMDARMKLIAKYLPDDRAPQDINLGGQDDNPVLQRVERVIVDPANTNS